MPVLFLVLPGIGAAVLSWLLTPLARWLALRLGAVDRPIARKIHVAPTPRLGGLAVVGAAVLVFAFVRATTALIKPESLWFGLAIGLIPILVVSFIDDVRRLPAVPKFVGHITGAVVAVALGVSLNHDVHVLGYTVHIGMWAAPISVMWLIGVTNAFNLVDGLDGLSAGLAFISAGSLVPVFLLVHQPGIAVAAMILAGALAGFLPYNFHPASSFLGDTGATAVGFTLACLALRGGSTVSAGFATLLPLIVFGVPVADTLLSIVRRAISAAGWQGRGRIFTADREHVHHRLLDLGLDQRGAVLVLYAAGVCLAAAALVSVFLTAEQAGLLLAGLLLAVFVGVGRLGYNEFAVIRSGVVLRLYDAPVLKRSIFVVFIDILFVGVGVFAAIGLKHDDWTLSSYRALQTAMTATLVPTTVLVLWLLRVYRGSWRLASVYDSVRICAAIVAASFLGFVCVNIVFRQPTPMSLFLIYALVATALALGSRMSYRILAASRERAVKGGVPALIYGAGQGGAGTLREMLSNPHVDLHAVGFIDDDPLRAGKTVNGVPIVGNVNILEACIRANQAGVVVISTRKIPPTAVVLAREACRRAGARLVRMEIRFEEVRDALGALRPEGDLAMEPVLVQQPAEARSA